MNSLSFLYFYRRLFSLFLFIIFLLLEICSFFSYFVFVHKIMEYITEARVAHQVRKYLYYFHIFNTVNLHFIIVFAYLYIFFVFIFIIYFLQVLLAHLFNLHLSAKINEEELVLLIFLFFVHFQHFNLIF